MKNRSRFAFHIEALNDEDWMVRAEAAMMLGRTGPFTRATVPALSRALTDDVVHVRYHAAVSLGRLGEQARAERSEDSAQPNDWSEIPMNIGAAVPALNSALSDGEEAVRGSAAFALGLIGESAHAAIPTIIQTLQDSNWWVRANAAMALGRLCQQVGRSTQTAVHALERALSDESQWVRHAAAGALGGIGQSAQAAVPALVKALRDDENDEVRLRAIGVLGEIGELAQVENPECVGAAVPALREALRDKDSRIRRVAEMVLCRMGKLPMTAGPTLSVNRPSSAWHHDSNRNRRKSPSRMGTNASGLSNPMYPRTRRASIAVS